MTKPKRAPKLQKMTERHSTLTFMKMMQNAAVVIPRKQKPSFWAKNNRISKLFGNATDWWYGDIVAERQSDKVAEWQSGIVKPVTSLRRDLNSRLS